MDGLETINHHLNHVTLVILEITIAAQDQLHTTAYPVRLLTDMGNRLVEMAEGPSHLWMLVMRFLPIMHARERPMVI